MNAGMPDSAKTRLLRIALFGAGRHAQHHARAILRCPEAKLIAVADPSDTAQAAMRATDDQLRSRNLKSVLDEAKAAREIVTTIGGQLETMLLQGFQIERDTVDVARAEHAAEESHEAVARLQDVVDARRRAASRLNDLFTPEGETGARA